MDRKLTHAGPGRNAGWYFPDMTAPDRPDLATTLSRLRDRFLSKSAAMVQVFVDLAERIGRDPLDPETLDTLHRELHRTHGTSGSYGFHAASRTAAALESVAARWVADPALDAIRRAAIVGRFAEALERAFSGGTAGRRVLLVEVPDELFAPLVSEVLHRGFAPERLSPAALATALQDDPRAFAGLIAGLDTAIPAVDGVVVTRLASGGDAAAAVTSCCGPPP
jgi:HPt (histidine-containing phosphotransfer) domain-containing protein